MCPKGRGIKRVLNTAPVMSYIGLWGNKEGWASSYYKLQLSFMTKSQLNSSTKTFSLFTAVFLVSIIDVCKCIPEPHKAMSDL